MVLSKISSNVLSNNTTCKYVKEYSTVFYFFLIFIIVVAYRKMKMAFNTLANTEMSCTHL